MINFKQLRMNMKFVTMSMCMVFALAFSACHKSGVYDPATEKVSDLKVPEGFDWNTSEDVALMITSPVETEVSVYSDEACKELLATLPASMEENTFTLNVKSGTKNLYVQYLRENGSKSVLTVPVTVSRAAVDKIATVKLPEGTGERTNDQGGYVMHYPSTHWGTLLFEDMWPSKGDYDFNDVAASYKIQLYLTKDASKVEMIMVSVRLNALGGYFPYQLCLQIDNLKATSVSEVESYTTNGDGSGTYKFETEGTDSKALFSFDWKDKKGSTAGKYYNTEKEYALTSADLDKNQFAFIMYLDEEQSLNEFSNSVFNFFIRKTDGTEIHMMGYAPTDGFMDKYNEIVKNNTSLSADEYYRTTDGFVWGLKIPANVHHVVEDIDFIQAYPLFKDWVTTGGVKNPEWYEERNRDYCIDF